MKNLWIIAAVLLSQAAHASQVLSVECVDAKKAKTVSAVLDLETGDQTRFSHYINGKETVSQVYHIEGDADALPEGVMMEVSTVQTDGSPVAKLTVMLPTEITDDSETLILEGSLVVVSGSGVKTISGLSCALTTAK